MLKKPNRLQSNFEFNISRKYGKHITSKYFHFYTLEPRNYTGPTKVGIVVSKKYHKSAVKRNKVKRIFRECTRRNFDKINQNLWMIFHPRTICQNATYAEICSDITKVLQEVSIPR